MIALDLIKQGKLTQVQNFLSPEVQNVDLRVNICFRKNIVN